jgi:transposase
MARSIEVIKIREIIQLYESGIDSFRAIGRALQIDHEAVAKVVRKACALKLNFDDVKCLGDDKLYQMFYPDNTNIKYPKPDVDVEKVIEELRNHKTLTIKMLWEEYKQEHPDGLGYTQFRERIKDKIKERNITMHIQRIPGEKIYVDWAGDTMTMYDSKTGEEIKLYLFVSVLGVSSIAYVEAFLSTKLECFIQGNVNALTYYGACPVFLVPDNDRSAVTKSCKYDPVINETYKEMANFYGITVFPARSRKPKDKGSVEKGVLDAAERNIINRFRHMKFFSLEEVNDRICEEINRFNQKPYEKEPDTNRLAKFQLLDKPAMRPLPQETYEFSQFKVATVNIDSHIEVDYKLYSVPFQYIGRVVQVRIGTSHIRIYYNNGLIANHLINKSKLNRHTTNPDHLPERSAAYLKKNKDEFFQWASTVSDSALEIVKAVFESSKTEEYAYRPCLGLKRLYKTYGPTRFINACNQGVQSNIKTYNFVKSMVENPIGNVTDDEKIINHKNIRGKETYMKTGG